MGEYSYALDNKGRVKVPAPFKADLAPRENSILFLTRDVETCIAVYTPEEYQKLRAGFHDVDMEDQEARIRIRKQISSAFKCQVDSQLRIKVPVELIKHARLEKGGTVKIAGFVHYVQIWNPEQYLKSMQSDG